MLTLHDSKVFQKRRSSLRSHITSLLQDSAGQIKSQASPDSQGGKVGQEKLKVQKSMDMGRHGYLGPWILRSTQKWKESVSAGVHALFYKLV